MLINRRMLHRKPPGNPAPTDEKVNPLSYLSLGEAGTVRQVCLEGTLRCYLARFGFTEGAVIRVIRRVPLGGLRVYRIGQAEIALRPEMAETILVLRHTE